MSNNCPDIFQFIEEQESAYKLPIKMTESWDWSMAEHIKTSENYINSQLNNGKNEFTPVKNIILPILNLQHRAEDIDVKDVQIYIDNKDKFHLSLLVKKYHDDVFIKENDMETFFDDLNVSRIDYGAGISKKLKKPAPEVVPLQSIAFCSQKDILSAPFGLTHEFGVDQLLEMGKFGWGNTANGATSSIEELITLWRDEEKQSEGIKIYEIHGNMPRRWFEDDGGKETYQSRIAIVAFYQKKDMDKRKGVILYTAEENINDVFKVVKRDKIYGRAIGRGGAEELFEAQVWTTYDMIRMQNMLDAAAVTLMQTTDPTIITKHPDGLKGLKNLSIIEKTQGTEFGQVDTFPRNFQLFDKSSQEWEQHARTIGAAQDPILGVAPTAGTPFASLQAQIQQGMGLHDYRRGQYSAHVEEIYNDWIIPHIEKEICKDTTFLSTLSSDELNYVADKMAVNEWNKYFFEKTMSGGEFQEGEMEQWISDWKDSFKKDGGQKFISLLRSEFKGCKLKVSVQGKSKNLAAVADKITKIFQFIFANPQGFIQTMQIPGMAQNFNQLIEDSGMTPADFSGIEKYNPQPAQPAQTPVPA